MQENYCKNVMAQSEGKQTHCSNCYCLQMSVEKQISTVLDKTPVFQQTCIHRVRYNISRAQSCDHLHVQYIILL